MDFIRLVSWFLLLQCPGYLTISSSDDKYLSTFKKENKYISKTCNEYRQRLGNRRAVTILQQLSVLSPEWKVTKLDPDPLGEIYNYAFQALLLHLFCPHPLVRRKIIIKKRNSEETTTTEEPATISPQCSLIGNCQQIKWDY
ncbi:uncharacterized protein LOC113493948 [Trichoplusia ni]|uniref:Uncharacterized protein LOC113493948 n=1 Tax=Trichoplusia ni TaxID=7111 RepID=A0A7E5VHJ6_TRINI|nr:uncharacterized protein LOC113493948 [Trichoplusia ni]